MKDGGRPGRNFYGAKLKKINDIFVYNIPNVSLVLAIKLINNFFCLKKIRKDGKIINISLNEINIMVN